MNISKRKQGILAIICTIAMIVTSITVYNPREVKADPSATVDGKQYSATVKDSGEWTGFACQGIFDSARIHFAWGIAVDAATITASLNGNQLKVAGQNANGMNIPLSEVTSLGVGSYDIVINATTVASESAEAKEISATATLKIEKVEGTTELQKPSAPTSLVANINDLKTDYTIAFSNVATATSYKFYLDGTYKKDITNGGIVTIEELGLEAGKTYKFGVSAVNAAGESDITTIDVTVPGQEEETTTAAYKDGEVLVNESNQTKEVPAYTDGDYWQNEYNNMPVKYVKGKKYVAEVVVSSTAAKKIKMVFQRVNIWDFVDANQGYETSIAAGNKVKITYVFEATQSTDNGNFDIYLGSVADKTTLVFESKKLTTYNEVPAGVQTGVEVIPSQTKYTVTEDGVAKEVTEGSSYTFGKNEQGYYDATNGVAYAPEEVITVDRNITVTGIKLNVAMESGAGIKLTTPTGLRFKTNVTGTTDILSHSNIIKTGTIITASDILDGGTVDDDFVKSNKLKLNIENENNGWYGNTAGTFCASIVELQEANYARDFVGVGYVTITYNNNKTKTIYAPSGTVRAVATVAQNIQNSKAIYQDGMTYYDYLKSKGYGTIIDTYAAAKKNNQ
ncbi:hypothetical protein [Eubacterium ventriosum]|uniref:hypothetical protein n=1 Tax=Eubacterium ventriosum TaxID=39496 RepID=UPI002E77132E|nr:hypothetical protein [Eubacterium ventriosum]MEE0855265.1 hypothetical protein [Eubacterium ventriosum]